VQNLGQDHIQLRRIRQAAVLKFLHRISVHILNVRIALLTLLLKALWTVAVIIGGGDCVER
jgi:hypothetical protein